MANQKTITAVEKALVRFPSNYPRVTTAVMLQDGRTVLTGHESGLIVKSDLVLGKYDAIDDCNLPVTSIDVTGTGLVLVGCHSGLLYLFHLDDPSHKTVLHEPSFSKRDRIWRVRWLDDSRFLTGSTFGVLLLYQKDNSGNWPSEPVEGHSDSIFGLASSPNLIISGDWLGKIIVRGMRDSKIVELDQLKIQNGIQAITCHTNGNIAAVDRWGRIHVFEAGEANEWRSVYETDTATSWGSSIHITNDGGAVYAGTQTELIQFDLDTQQLHQYSIGNVRGIFSNDSFLYVVSDKEITSLARKQIPIDPTRIQYQYSKLSFIGQSGVGKTTICSNFVDRSAEGIESTFGRKIWIKDVETYKGSPQRKIILHDHGGQESVLGTFLPFLTDSDIIVIFFQKNDYTTFETAERILVELQDIISRRTKVFFVQTFSDFKMADINPRRIKDLIDSGKIIDCVSVNSKDLADVDQLFARIIKEISWETEKIMTKSAPADGVLRTVANLSDSDATVVPIDEVSRTFKETTGFDVSRPHLTFLLDSLGSQGIVEYYPDIYDGIILNDDKYNKLKTDIPIFVRNSRGIVKANSILKDFQPRQYAEIIDRLYLAYKISIENNGLRIFPSQLKRDKVEPTEELRRLLSSAEPAQRTYREQTVKPARLIEALTDLKLKCIDASQAAGIFAWETNACVYYFYNHISDAVKGDRVEFTYYIAGTKPLVCDRLTEEFSGIIDRFFGPAIEPEESKKKLGKTFKYAVALTFAGEIRPIAKQISDIIRGGGLNVFFDGYMKAELWGKNRTAFFQKAFYEESKWCIMLVSKEYVTKKWPSFEAEHAIARQVEQFGNYILPVYFDDTRIPGLPVTVSPLHVPPETPESIASTFLEKFENEP